MIKIPFFIPITIRPLFWLLAAFIGWISSNTINGTLLSVAVILISVLFHEFGHALTARAFGQKTRIELAVFGGFTYRQGRKLKLREEFLVVANGPLAGLLLFGISWFLLNKTAITNPSLLFALKFSSLVNLFWTLMNLVPVLPLDGGHLLSIILEGIFGFKGIKMAIYIGLIIAVAISIVFFAIGAFLVGALFLILTFESFRSLRYYKMLTEQDRDTDLQQLMKEGEAAFNAGEEEKALDTFQQVREKAKKGVLYTLATEEMAEIFKHQGQYHAAYDFLVPIQKSLSPEMIPQFHFLAYQNRDYKKVTELAKESYQLKPNYETAIMNAIAFASLDKVEPAIGWLECAIREGLPAPKEHLKKKEFDRIRSDSRFKKIELTL
jgi:stage IV sporulation protein FB